jgi:hypothetical protein
MRSEPKAPRSCRVCPSRASSSRPRNQPEAGALRGARFLIRDYRLRTFPPHMSKHVQTTAVRRFEIADFLLEFPYDFPARARYSDLHT